MIDPGLLARDFERNTWIIEAQTEGLSHEDSLLQTEFHINCLNWTLGHILDARGRVLEALGMDRVLPAEDTERYRRESEPVLADEPGILSLPVLLTGLRETQTAISAALGALDIAAMMEKTESSSGKPTSLGAIVHFEYFHDTYHTGQTELLRQVTGVGDKII
jgi:hypothetical protein